MEEVFRSYDFPHHKNEHAVSIYQDALITMRQMQDESVDLVFADPPYNLGKDFGNGSDHWENKRDYLHWCAEWIHECFRLLKRNGTIYLMNATQNMPYIDQLVDEHYHILSRIVWTYDSSGVQPKKMFGSLYEPILMATKSRTSNYTFNGEDIMVEARTGAQRKLIDYRKTPPAPYNTKKIPGNVWNIPRVRYRMKEYENHPTQKPEALLERMIFASSHKGDVVLDPFAGTFTTCAVALKHGRRAIGIELNEAFYKIGLRRLGLAETYKGERLLQDRSRKTDNKSKKDHRA